MIINAYGVLSDHLNRVLLQKERTSGKLAPPSRIVAPGQLPPDLVAAAFREETGLVIMPVRLTGVYFRPGQTDTLSFCFRCLLRGGTLAVAAGQAEAGFFDSRPLPQPMQPFHQRQVGQALYHNGGHPHWEEQPSSLLARLRAWTSGDEDKPSTPLWQVRVTAVVPNAAGQVLWVKRPGGGGWELPTAERRSREAPWDSARRAMGEALGREVTLAHLAAVYLGKDEPTITFVFTADQQTGQANSTLAAAYFAPGAEPDRAHPPHLDHAAMPVNPEQETRFILQPGNNDN